VCSRTYADAGTDAGARMYVRVCVGGVVGRLVEGVEEKGLVISPLWGLERRRG